MSKLVARLSLSLLDQRTIRRIVCFICVGVSLYLLAIFWLGWQETAAAFDALGFHTLLIGSVMSCTSYLWRFLRWEYALKCLGNIVPRCRHLGIYLSGLALTATPGKSGETFRSALLVKHGVRVSHSLAAFLVDRASDVLGVCLLGALAAWGTEKDRVWVWMLSFTVMLIGSCAFSCLLSRPLDRIYWQGLCRYLKWQPVKAGQATLEAWASVWQPSRVLVFSSVAVLAYGTQAFVFAWFSYILGTGVSSADCVLIFVKATLFGAATMLPGGLGAMEAALVFQFVERGVNNCVAVSLAISIRLVTLWIGMSVGALSLLFSSNKDLTAE